MSYAIFQLDVTAPLPTLKLDAENIGVALIVRRQDRLIGRILEASSPSCILTPDILEALLEKHLSSKLLEEAIRAEFPTQSPSEQFPTLTVAVCTKDRPDNVNRLLQSLMSLQINEGQSQFDILIVDNAPSDDRTQQVVAKFPTVHYTHEPKPGLNFARNHALKIATGDWLAFLDDDVIIDRQWFRGFRTAWVENPDAGAFTGLVLPLELDTPAQILFEQRGGFGRGFEKIRYGRTLPGNPLYPCGAGIFGAGCNMAFRRQLLLDLGGFDDALDTGKPLPGGGDLDIFYRVIRAGWPLVYEPQYAVYHQHRREMNQLRHQYWTWGMGFMAFVMKTMEVEPDMRGQLVRLIFWWIRDQVRQLQQSLLGRHILSPNMILSELWGGVVGLLGEYRRSQRRIEIIRRRFS